MRRVLPLLCVLILIVAACGGDSGEGASVATTVPESQTDQTTAPDTQADSAGTDEGSSDQGSAQGLPPGGTGTVTIDGETIEAQWVGNCIIDEVFDPHPDDLDLVAALDGGLNAIFIEVSFREVADGLVMQFRPEVQRQGDDGSYATYEAEGQYMLAPDGTWYLDTDGGLFVALFSGQPHEATALDEAPVVVDGGSIRGSVPLQSESGTVEVSFDLTYVEPVDCSL